MSGEELRILASWILNQMSKNSVLEELRVRRLAVSSRPGRDMLNSVLKVRNVLSQS